MRVPLDICVSLCAQFVAMMKEQAPRTMRNYPVAAAGINIARLLAVDIMHLDAAGAGAAAARRAPYWGVFEDPAAFYEVFSAAFRLLDGLWAADARLDYMQFNAVKEAVRARIARDLAEGPRSLAQFMDIALRHGDLMS